MISRWLLVKKRKKIAFWATLSGFKGNVRTPYNYSSLESPCRLLLVVIEHFFASSYGWDVMSGNLSKLAFFEGGGSLWAHADFRGKGASYTNHCWCQSSRVIALSCGIKISAVHHLYFSQSTRVTDRDGQTDRRTDRITTPKTALAYARAVKSRTIKSILLSSW